LRRRLTGPPRSRRGALRDTADDDDHGAAVDGHVAGATRLTARREFGADGR
jgi:hypothetical protein